MSASGKDRVDDRGGRESGEGDVSEAGEIVVERKIINTVHNEQDMKTRSTVCNDDNMVIEDVIMSDVTTNTTIMKPCQW